MVKLIDPQIHADGTIDTCGDPTMGTGGFLITYLQYILQQAKIKNIKPDWNFIKTDGLYGKEIEPDTYIHNLLKSEYLPIKTDNAVSLFIQSIIYMLKINGKCAVVLPDGQDLFSKTNKILILIREYLLKTCDLKEIIYLPSGIFIYTNIKTCVLYFIKKIDSVDIFKKSGKDYKFVDTHQTTEVSFYNYNDKEDTKTLLIKAPINKIINNKYSLNYQEYIEEIKEEYKEEI